MLNAAETDIRTLNRHGVAAWGLALPFWMKASWFRKQGYKRVDRDEMAVLMWKAFRDDAVPPCWIKEKKRPEKQPGVVTVTSFTNGWCPAQNITHERAKRVAQEFAGQVVFQEINTLCPQTLCEWGISDALFVDGRPIRIGPPPSIDKIRSILAGQVRKIPS